MNASIPSDGSRRFFLKECLLTAGAVATGGGFLQRGFAKETVHPDQVRKISVEGLLPANYVLGALVASIDGFDYLIFDTHQAVRAGRAAKPSFAVVRLTQCVRWKCRTDGDGAFAEHPIDLTKLDDCETYRVLNSTWIEKLVKEDPELIGPDVPPLHHLIFTFAENSFECVVAKIDAIHYTKSFPELYEHLSNS